MMEIVTIVCVCVCVCSIAGYIMPDESILKSLEDSGLKMMTISSN